jgi:hypothetical protein
LVYWFIQMYIQQESKQAGRQAGSLPASQTASQFGRKKVERKGQKYFIYSLNMISIKLSNIGQKVKKGKEKNA